MLNHTIYRQVSGTENPAARGVQVSRDVFNVDWCVGDAPVRWDVSFADRVKWTVRRMFSRWTLISTTARAKINRIEPELFTTNTRKTRRISS